MARVTEATVRKIIPETTLESLTPFIQTANVLTNTIEGLDEELMVQVELYLAAHFASVGDRLQRTTSEKVGDVSNTFTQANGGEIASTFYGQQALVLDTTGTLKRFVKAKKAAIHFL